MLFLPSSVRFSLRFSSLMSTGGRVKSFEETLIGSDFSLSRLLPLAATLSSTSSSLSSPSPYYVPQELAARSWARMPEKIFPRRRLPSERESAALRIFALFSNMLVHLRRPPTLSLSELDVHRAYGPQSQKFFVSSCFALFQQSVLLSLSPLPYLPSL